MWYVVQVPSGREEYLCHLIQRVVAEHAELEERSRTAEAQTSGAQAWPDEAEAQVDESEASRVVVAPEVPGAPEPEPEVSGVPDVLGEVAEAASEASHAAREMRAVGSPLKECFVPTCEFERKRRGEWRRVELPLFPGYVVVDTEPDQVARLGRMLRSIPEFTRVLRMGEAFTPLDEAECTWIRTFADAQTRSVPLSVGVMEGDRVRVVSGPLMGHEGQIKEIKRRNGIAVLEVHMFGRTMSIKVGLAIVTKRDGQQKSE